MPVKQFPPFVALGPESTFHLDSVEGNEHEAKGSMPTGEWTSSTDGSFQAGSFGVLIDDVLGFTVAASTPPGWSTVTTHLHADFLGQPGLDSRRVTAHVDSVDLDSTGGLATGSITDSVGRTLVRATLRGRFVEGASHAQSQARNCPDRIRTGDVMTRLNALVTDGAAQLTIPVDATQVNVSNNLHGGLIFCAAELATTVGDDSHAFLTSSVDVHYIRPAKIGSPVTFSAQMLHSGRQIRHFHLRAVDRHGKLIAVASIGRVARPA